MVATAFLLIFLLPALLPAQTDVQRLHKLFAEAFETTLREKPEWATFIGRTEYDDRWTDASKSARERRKQQRRDWLKELARFAPETLSEQDRVSARVFRFMVESELDTEEIEAELLTVSQLYGVHNWVFMTVDRMPNRTVKDYENIIKRLRAAPLLIEQNIAAMSEGSARGGTQPRVVIERVVQQVADQRAMDANTTPLLKAFREFPSNFPKAEQERLRDQAVSAYQKQFVPAWKQLESYLTNSYLLKARQTDGISPIPDGRRTYELLVRSSTTTGMRPEDIHRLGVAEVKRIEAEMQKVIAGTGFGGTLAQYAGKIKQAPGQRFRDRDEMLTYCRNAAKVVEPELPKLFKRIPVLLYGVRPIPPDQERAMATHAWPMAPDGSAPGWFELNTYEPEKQVRYDKEALVLHEAVPGHIFQSAVAWTIADLPEFRKYYLTSAYLEGWALYVESLGSQLGLYRTPESRFGQLASERFRAARLVVDTGMHALGWTRQQAIDYFREHAPEENSSEIDRYIAWPGQALAYKMGQLKIRQLRDMAERELGPKFDIREFHDVMLRNGPVPLDVLDEQVRAYVASAH
jgi:uncharacterized protein (DUF885 family)